MFGHLFGSRMMSGLCVRHTTLLTPSAASRLSPLILLLFDKITFLHRDIQELSLALIYVQTTLYQNDTSSLSQPISHTNAAACGAPCDRHEAALRGQRVGLQGPA